MRSNAAKQRLSLPRLLLVLVVVGGLIAVGVRYATAVVEDIRNGAPTTWFAPYVDVTLTPIVHFEEASARMSDDVVLGFVVADAQAACEPSWGTYYSLDAAARALDLDRRVVRLREQDGDVIVSFGGAINDELAVACEDTEQLTAAYQAVIDRYDLQVIDFDIEGAAMADQAANGRRVAATQRLLQANPGLAVWLTVPVAPQGLTAEGTALVDGFLQAGVELAGINLMTMNYAESRTADTTMHMATVQALEAAAGQVGQAYRQAGYALTEIDIWQRIGATPMIGQNDVAADVFTISDAHALVEYARSRNLGRLSFWSLNRDVACGAGVDLARVSNTCSGVRQDPREFTSIFVDGTGRRVANGRGLDQLPLQPETVEAAGSAAFVRDDPRTSPYPLWQATGVYEEGDKVVWQGRVYQAKWWSEGDQPDAPVEHVWETPWRYLGPVLESDREAVRTAVLSGNWERWTSDNVFLGGDEVEYNNQVFRAKWWTQGDEPQQFPDRSYDHPWEYLGDVDCNGDSCVGDEAVTMLSVDYGGLTGIGVEIREDNGLDATAGRLVRAYSNQSGQKTYEVLEGTYDLVFQMGAAERILDAVDCLDGACEAADIAATLAVDYDGLTDIRLEIRTDDGLDGTAGDLLQVYDGQSGQRSYHVLRGSYDLVFDAGATELIVDSVACDVAQCRVEEIGAILSVDYEGLTAVDLEIRSNDHIEGTAGMLVQAHTGQRGRRSFHVLRGSYDLVFEQGDAELIVDAFDCTRPRCEIDGMAAELIIDYGDTAVSIEIRTDDGRPGTAGGPVATFDEQDGRQLYAVLRGSYDLVAVEEDSARVYDSLDCSNGRCSLEIPWRLIPYEE